MGLKKNKTIDKQHLSKMKRSDNDLLGNNLIISKWDDDNDDNLEEHEEKDKITNNHARGTEVKNDKKGKDNNNDKLTSDNHVSTQDKISNKIKSPKHKRNKTTTNDKKDNVAK